MSQFLKKFLTAEGSQPAAGLARFLALGVFGKHPGWDDHIEDLGLDTQTLTLAKRILYVQGVGGQIDTGAWEKLDPTQRLEEFNHVFLWQRSRRFLLGKMWSSTDGKGRSRYPMVICAECGNVSLAWALQQLLPRLDGLELACKSATSADAVRAALDRARAEMRAALGGPAVGDDYAPATPATLERFVAAPALGPNRQGWFRLLYQLQNQAQSYAVGNFNGKNDVSSLRPQQIRVPKAADSAPDALLLWARFFSWQTDSEVPTFLAVPAAGDWLDVVLGEPASQEFFCLRALPAALPLVTEVPYAIEEGFKARAGKLLDSFQSGKEAPAGSALEPAEPVASGWASITQRWFRGKGLLLFLAAFLAVGALAGWWWAKSPSALSANAPQAKPKAAAGVGSEPRPAAVPMVAAPAAPKKPLPAPDQTIRPAAPAVIIPPAKPAVASSTGSDTAKRLPAASQNPVAASVVALAAPPANETARASPPPAPPGSPSVIGAGTDVAPVPPSLPATPVAAPAVASAPSPLPSSTATPNPPVPSSPAPVGNSEVADSKVASPAPNPSAAAQPPSPGPHPTLTNSIGMILVWLPSLPGAPNGAWVGQFEVTQKEFQSLTGANPSQSKNPLQPVEMVALDDAVLFCQKMTDRDQTAGVLPAGFAYRLPTQRQWEALLGDAKFEDAVISLDKNQPKKTSPAPVGSLRSNQFGLYDVLGNVWEWCADPAQDGRPVAKGASYNTGRTVNFRELERTSALPQLSTKAQSPFIGFRCLLAPAS